ncbi:MAG: hypothetical protein RIE08_15555 [Acidimicrobiales bacterium]
MTRALDLCGVGRGGSCVILHDPSTPTATVAATRLAAHRAGARPILVEVPAHGDAFGEDAVIAAGSSVDLVVDLTAKPPDPRGGSSRLIADGGHVLRIGAREASDLATFVAHPGIERRVHAAMDALREASSMSVVTTGPTMLSFDLRDAEVSGTWGATTAETPTAQWPGGLVRVDPVDDDCAGAVAVMAGDVVAPANRHVIAPAAVLVEAGHVCEITGSDDAALIRALFETVRARSDHLGGDGVYRLRSVRIGMHPTAPLDPDVLLAPALTRPDADVRNGVVTIAFGLDDDTAVEVRLRSATVTVDEVTVVSHGRLAGSFEPDVYEEVRRRR